MRVFFRILFSIFVLFIHFCVIDVGYLLLGLMICNFLPSMISRDFYVWLFVVCDSAIKVQVRPPRRLNPLTRSLKESHMMTHDQTLWTPCINKLAPTHNSPFHTSSRNICQQHFAQQLVAPYIRSPQLFSTNLTCRLNQAKHPKTTWS